MQEFDQGGKEFESGNVEYMSQSNLARLTVRVVANAHKPGLVSLVDKVLHCKVAAAPADGRANEELCQTLAKLIGVAPSGVVVRFGHSARQKVVEIAGVDETRLFAILRQHLVSRAGVVQQ